MQGGSDRTGPWRFVGTALATDETETDNKHLPVWKQEVTDSEGRRRFHGAFTGGFSAGYYNTVGSKEGWTPTAFVSSRSKRAGVQQKKEDFMDDEDYVNASGGGALATRPEFELDRTSGGTRVMGLIPGPIPQELIAPAESPIGVKLLRLMGWRDGQGIGPRQPAIGKQEGKRVYGLQLSLNELLGDTKPSEEAQQASTHMVAPKDTEVLDFEVKNNFHGIGYDPLRHHGTTRNRMDSRAVETKGPVRLASIIDGSGPASGDAFGLGAFEDADDPDIYTHDPRRYHA